MRRFLVLILCAVGGCQSLSRPFPIQAVDAETGQPIVGADLHIHYNTTASPGSGPRSRFLVVRHEVLYDDCFVGTRSEFDVHRPSDPHPGSEERSAGGSKGGRGGGRHCHGGAPDASASDAMQTLQ